MKTSKLTIQDFFNALDKECFEKQVSLDGFFKNVFANKVEKFCSMEMTLSQRRRVLRLVNYISLGFKKSKFDFYVVFQALEIFVKATNGKDENTVKTIFRSFTRVPKWNKPKRVKKINSEEKSRDNWGRTSYLRDLGVSENYDNILRRIAK